MSPEMDVNAASEPRLGTVGQALREGTAALAGSESARLDAELLLAQALGLDDRSKLYLHHDRPLAARARALFHASMLRRANHEPVAYITGRREFWSLDFLVTPAVLVPRPETELLVEAAIDAASRMLDGRIKILDLGTGSGAIAVSVAKEIAAAEIWATDISAEAIAIARSNARRHGVEHKIQFVAGDLFHPVRERPAAFDLIVSNPPYVRRDELGTLPRDVREFEPHGALDGGPDGLDFYRRIIPEARRYLAPGGLLALEIGADMAEEVVGMFAAAGGYAPARVHRDYTGRDRAVSAAAPVSP